MKQNSILEAQEEYLKTGSEKALSSLYIQLMKLGKYSIQKNKHGTEEDLEDIVTNYILKLMTDKNITPIQHPSGYIKAALFYSQKPKTRLVPLLPDEAYNSPEGLDFKPTDSMAVEFEDDLIQKMDSEQTFITIYQIIDNYIIENDIKQEEEECLINCIIDCIECGKYYKKYLYKISKKKTKEHFIDCFELMETILRKEVAYE